MLVTLKIASKRAGGRSQARSLERVEREVLAGVARTPTRDGVTVLQVRRDDDEAFDRRVDDRLVAIALTARAASLYVGKRGVGRGRWRTVALVSVLGTDWRQRRFRAAS